MYLNITKFIFLILLLISTSYPSFALETDNFLALTEDIADSVDILNQHYNQVIQRRIDRINNGRFNKTCHNVATQIGKEFIRGIEKETQTWVMENEDIDRIPRYNVSKYSYWKDSIYSRSIVHLVAIAPTLNVNGIHMGTDKLSHFFILGFSYYLKYLLDTKNQGLEEPDYNNSQSVAEFNSEKKRLFTRAIKIGMSTEKGILGKLPTGVYSFGDLEANFQGLTFYYSLCDGPKPYLKVVDGNWVMTRPLDLREYVNPYLDETYNHSVYTPWRWWTIKANLSEYCETMEDPKVVERFERYKKYAPSFSVLRLRELLTRANTLNLTSIYSFQNLCD
ncbi:MAG: hypothetical protein HQK49_11525 [Oligoflexia bacterium]|nr:hypothetical protein [Oligoflexia bacterium]